MGRPLVGRRRCSARKSAIQKETALSNASDFFWSAGADKKASPRHWQTGRLRKGDAFDRLGHERAVNGREPSRNVC